MPAERIYEQQIAPRPGAMRPTADAADFGGNVADAATRAGAQLHSDQVRAYEIERKRLQDTESADFGRRYAEYRLGMVERLNASRSAAQPGGAGHANAIGAMLKEERAGLLDAISDPDVRQMAEAQLDEFGVKVVGGETEWAEGQRVGKLVLDTQTGIETSASLVRATASADPGAFASELRTVQQGVAALSVDPLTRDKLMLHASRTLGQAFIENTIDSNPRTAMAMLDSGEFSFLEPETVDALRSAAGVEVRRQEAAAEHLANVARAQVSEAIQTMRVQAGQGLEIPDGDLQAAIKAADDMGDTSLAQELRGMQADNSFARIYASQSPLQRQGRLTELKGKPKTTPAEQAEIKWLEDHRAALDARFNQDPVGFQLENGPQGSAPPALGDGGPKAIMARVAWRRSTGAATGNPRMPPFTAAEAQNLAGMLASGQGEQAVLDLLDNFPEGPERALAAQQIAPNDPTFRAMAQVEPGARQLVRAGQQVLKDNPRFLTLDANEFPDQTEMMADWDRRVALALKMVPPADQQAVRTVARQWVAGLLQRSQLTGETIDSPTYEIGYRMALGGEKAIRNGRVVWLGGPSTWGEHPFILPDGVSTEDFGRRVGAFLRAKPQEGPFNPDGTPIPITQLRPVLIGPGLYRWESANGRVALLKDGRTPFISDFNR